MLLWKVMMVWLWRVYYTTLKIICKDEKWEFLVKKCDLSGISAKLNIPTPCALKANFQIFGWGMRTQFRKSVIFGVRRSRRIGNKKGHRQGVLFYW